MSTFLSNKNEFIPAMLPTMNWACLNYCNQDALSDLPLDFSLLKQIKFSRPTLPCLVFLQR